MLVHVSSAATTGQATSLPEILDSDSHAIFTHHNGMSQQCTVPKIRSRLATYLNELHSQRLPTKGLKQLKHDIDIIMHAFWQEQEFNNRDTALRPFTVPSEMDVEHATEEKIGLTKQFPKHPKQLPTDHATHEKLKDALRITLQQLKEQKHKLSGIRRAHKFNQHHEINSHLMYENEKLRQQLVISRKTIEHQSKRMQQKDDEREEIDRMLNKMIQRLSTQNTQDICRHKTEAFEVVTKNREDIGPIN